MTEQGSGLRFDIYERVHLPEGLDGIAQLEAAELAPHIQVIEEADYAVVKGSLWLTGSYRNENGQSGQALEHLIPVEITMPLNRIHRLEDIRVVIDQFDVELMTNRSMNVTGVLSLHGLEMISFQEGGVWETPKQEETVFVYEHEPQTDTDTERSLSAIEAEEGRYEEEQETLSADVALETVAQFNISSYEEGEGQELRSVAETEVQEEEAAPEAFTQEQEEEAPAQTYYAEELYTRVYADSEQQEEEGEPSYVQETVKEEPIVTTFIHAASRAEAQAEYDEALREQEWAEEQEMREWEQANVARTATESISHLHAIVRPAPEQVYEAEAVRGDSDAFGDKLEWKKLFIHENEQQVFKKLRICIVQKEETLETIADRYRLNTRELVLYNRLGGADVNEGQILYIPTH